MKLGKVIANVVSTIKHPAYDNKPLYMVQPLNERLEEKGAPWIATDYVSAQIGDIVLFVAAPGLAKEVFKLKKAPIRSIIVAIVNIIEVDGKIVYQVK